MNKEQRKKLSISMKQYRQEHPIVFTEEIRRKMRENHKGMFGRNHTEATKKRISEALKENHPYKGKHLSKSHRAKISEGIRKYRLNHPNFQKGKNHPCYGIHREQSEETRGKIRKARLSQILPLKDTKIEIKIQDVLKKEGIKFVTHYPIKGQPDIVIEKKKIVIFCDGCYWHSCLSCFPNGDYKKVLEKDKRVTKELTELGWKVIRLWGHDILNNLDYCIDKILRVWIY